MYNGDTAIVSMQYSFPPSWLSFLVDKENARQAGQALFEAVDEKVRELPEGQRPKIVVFGESLGSFGGEAPFLSPNNIIARTNGALFSGPTFQNTMRDDVTFNRDPGSPEWLPIFDDGANVRFAARAENLGRPDAPGAIRGSPTSSTPPTRSRGGTRPAVRHSGLAARATRLRRVRRHELDPGGDLPPGVRRHGSGGRRTGRPRTSLRQGRRQRLGRGHAATRLDAGEDRAVARDGHAGLCAMTAEPNPPT